MHKTYTHNLNKESMYRIQVPILNGIALAS